MQKLLTLLLLAGSAAYGSTIQFTGLPLNTTYGTFNGFAFATVDGTPGQSLICDDFDHTTYVPSGPMEFDPSKLTGPTPVQAVRFVQPGDRSNTLLTYEEAAILLDGLNHTGPGLLLDLTADYQYALWHLFTPGVPLPNATAQALLDDAAFRVRQGGSANDLLYGRLRIYTPTGAFASNQEFLQLVPNPEPSPAVLMLLGVVVIAGSVVWRRRLKKRQQA